MEETWGQRLQAARKRAGYRTQEALGDLIGKSGRQVRNYETGKTAPENIDAATREALRRFLGPFDEEGDPVESAIMRSALTEDRKFDVRAHYKRRLREQQEEAERRGSA